MLLVKTYLAPSQFGGIGCFADEDIPAGQKIWSFNKRMSFAIEEKKLEEGNFSKHILDHFDEYALKLSNNPGWLFLQLDNSRFMRESETPNTGWVDIASHMVFVFSAKDIKKGEELTFEPDEDEA